MRNKHIAGLVAAVALAACSTSEVYSVGDGAYRVNASAITTMGGSGQAVSSAVKKANAFCAQHGKTAVVDSSSTGSNVAQGSGEVTFHCE